MPGQSLVVATTSTICIQHFAIIVNHRKCTALYTDHRGLGSVPPGRSLDSIGAFPQSPLATLIKQWRQHLRSRNAPNEWEPPGVM